jgi:hypothetical protein
MVPAIGIGMTNNIRPTSIADLNAQLQQAVSIVTELACEVQDEWDAIPTKITRLISSSELAQELRELARGERQFLDAPAIYQNY